MRASQGALRGRAFALVSQAREASKRGRNTAQPQLDLLALALQGKKTGFAKVIKMINAMTANLKTEQGEDDSLKAYCVAGFDKADDKKKALENAISDSESAISDMNG